MKKVIAAIISLSFLLILSGCGLKISYWGGMTRNQCEKYVTEQLKGKYNEEFTVVKFIKTGSGELKGVCAPERDERLLFDIELDKGYKGELEFADIYIQSIVREEMLKQADEVLSKHFDNYVVEIYVYGLASTYDSGIRSAPNASIKTFTEALSENYSVMWIAIDKAKGLLSSEEIQDIAKEIANNFHRSTTLMTFYYVSNDVVNECKQEINNRIKNGNDIINKMESILSTNIPWYRYRYRDFEVEFWQEHM